ncbi:MAG: FG-GAP-like repeat-containing protein, partial [Acidimicrobiales bacterium]
RYNPDGTLDTSFDTDGKATTAVGPGDDGAAAVAVQSDGKVVAVGLSSNGVDQDFALARYADNGALDATFGTGGTVVTAVGGDDDGANAVALQTDGKIVVAGFSFNGVDFDFAVVRYTSAGALDSGFGEDGAATTDISGDDDGAAGVVIQSDGRIVAAGDTNAGPNIDFALARFNPDGSPDSTFGTNGKVTTDFNSDNDRAFAVALSGQKIVAAGDTDAGPNNDFALARYDAGPPAPTTTTTVPAARAGTLIMTGTVSGAPEVRVFTSSGAPTPLRGLAYDARSTSGVRVASGDLTGDGRGDIIAAPGPGSGPLIRIFDGATGAELAGGYPFAQTFTGGVYVASGDVNGDGTDDIITAAGAGGGPHVRVFSGKNGAEIRSFFAYDTRFTGGVRVAAGDLTLDGKAEVITAPGPGGGPHVRVWDGDTGKELGGLPAYGTNFSGGVYVAAGDVNGDGRADIIAGPGAGSEPQVRVFSGLTGAEIGRFLAYGSAFTGGVTVASGDVTGDGRADILTGPGPGGGPHVRGFSGATGAELGGFLAYDSGFTGGVLVAVIR